MSNENTKREDGESTEAVEPIRVGVSACVLGTEVRWNGGHKKSGFVANELGAQVSFVPVCPEVEIGLPVPRPTARLVARKGRTPDFVMPKSGAYLTERMQRYAAAKVSELANAGLSGFIVQKGSPSCGMERVRVYSSSGMPARNGRGIFTAELMRQMPLLPVEEDGRLNDPVLREHFVERVFAYSRLRALFSSAWTAADLVEFHSREKLLVLAHSDYRPLGRIVANAKRYSQPEWGRRYEQLFLEALSRPATVGRHVNVMQHVAGYFRRGLDAAGRREVADIIDAYRRALVPLIAPLTLLRHHARAMGVSYLTSQTYLHGQPVRLMPRSHLARVAS